MSACTCAMCSMCGGSGSMAVDARGRYVRYFDDRCDLETCEECNGSGCVDECDHCRDAREQDEDEAEP